MHPSGVEWRNGDQIRKVSVEEAAALQTFPVSYPWQGGTGKRYQQIGNAVPPMLAKAVLSAVTS
jgi:DNA (cytosine-5)-methyltransferase 1